MTSEESSSLSKSEESTPDQVETPETPESSASKNEKVSHIIIDNSSNDSYRS